MVKHWILILLIMGISLPGKAQEAVSDPLLTKARYLLLENRNSDALTLLEDVSPKSQDQMRFALAIGQALSRVQRFDEANNWLMRVEGDAAAEANYTLAKNFVAVNDHANAMLHLSKHLADKNHYPKKQVRLDPAFANLEDSREWIKLWQNEWYSDAEIQNAECDYLLSCGQIDEASALADQVISDYPGDPRAWFNLARIKQKQSLDRPFKDALDRSVQLAANNPNEGAEILRYLIESANYEKVNSLASALLRNDPSNPEYQISRSLARILSGKESLAMREIEAMENFGLAPAELYYQAGKKLKSSIPLQAEAYLTKAVDAGFMDARFYYERATLRINLNKPDLALDDFAMSLDINPSQPELYLKRAQVRLDSGDTEGACYDWKKAAELGNAKATDMLYKFCKLP
jgi:Tfp pilus assembly protein PilF